MNLLDCLKFSKKKTIQSESSSPKLLCWKTEFPLGCIDANTPILVKEGANSGDFVKPNHRRYLRKRDIFTTMGVWNNNLAK